MTREANCCEAGKKELEWVVWLSEKRYWALHCTEVKFCPFCGRDLRFAEVDSLESLLLAIAGYRGQGLRVCFDVDGLLAVKKGVYADREKIDVAVEVLRQLKSVGHTVIIQTARYMKLFDGDQVKAHEKGYHELVLWLNEHEIPWDEVYLGKASADFYLDDRGCRVNGSNGVKDWVNEFLPVLK